MTPPPKPDVSNPYQNASPVKIGLRREKRKVSGGVGSSVKNGTPTKEMEEAGKKTEMDIEKLSEKAKIEATVPKVSLRLLYFISNEINLYFREYVVAAPAPDPVTPTNQRPRPGVASTSTVPIHGTHTSKTRASNRQGRSRNGE